eukprot:gene5080-6888_t
MQALHDGAGPALTQVPLHDMMRYQDFGGTARDRDLGARWLSAWVPEASAERTLLAPGIHSVLLALVSMLAKPGQSLCVEALAYPGIKAIAAQLGTALLPLPMDRQGLLPEAFEAACKSTHVAALYLCPNLHNPTTATLPIKRREQIADIALRYSIPLIEDDAYGMLPAAIPPSLSEYAPGLTYYISGMSKWLGAGLRSAYVLSPTAATQQRLAGALRARRGPASQLVAARLHLDHLEHHLAGVVQAMHLADGDVGGLVLRQQVHLLSARDLGRALDDDPVFGAVVVLLQTQGRAGFDADALDLETLAHVHAVVP